MIIKVTSSGQITIPKPIRISLGIKKGDFLRIEVISNILNVKKLNAEELEELYVWNSIRSVPRLKN